MMRITSTAIALAMILAFLSSAAMATPLTYEQVVKLSSQKTDWMETISVDKFDPTLGRLDSVFLKVKSDIIGNFGYENTSSSSPTKVSLTIDTEISLSLNDAMLLQAGKSVSQKDNLAKFDQTKDFLGLSGRTYSGLSATASDHRTLSDPDYLKSFTGTGTIDLLVAALGMTSFSGGSNVEMFAKTKADATVRVIYNYTAVPVPGAVWLLGSGLVGLFGFRRRFRG